MTKIERKLRRKKRKKEEKALHEHMMWFDKMPDHCVNCFKVYVKNNKEMAQKWTVVVRKSEDKVNLYCDDCWNSANNMIKEIKEDLDEDKRST